MLKIEDIAAALEKEGVTIEEFGSVIADLGQAIRAKRKVTAREKFTDAVRAAEILLATSEQDIKADAVDPRIVTAEFAAALHVSVTVERV